MSPSIPIRDKAAMPALLSVAQLAAYLDVPVSTLYLWRSQGRGPQGLKVGKRVRYRAADVLEWLDDRAAVEKEVNPPTAA